MKNILRLISSDAKPLQLTEPIVRLAIDIAKIIYFTDIRTSNSTYNHTNYEQNQNYSIQKCTNNKYKVQS